MTENLNIVEKCVSCLDIRESYDLAKRMEQGDEEAKKRLCEQQVPWQRETSEICFVKK